MKSMIGQVLPVSEQISQLRHVCPDSIALSSGDRQLSYAELNRQADQFAGYLAQRGVVPGETVALCLERSFDWIFAALGIMRAGADYLPLDPAWPDARLRFAINDSHGTVLVARAALFARLNVGAIGVDPCRDAAAIAAAAPGTHSVAPLKPCLCDLYLGVDGRPEGRGDHARQPVSPHPLAPSSF